MQNGGNAWQMVLRSRCVVCTIGPALHLVDHLRYTALLKNIRYPSICVVTPKIILAFRDRVVYNITKLFRVQQY